MRWSADGGKRVLLFALASAVPFAWSVLVGLSLFRTSWGKSSVGSRLWMIGAVHFLGTTLVWTGLFLTFFVAGRSGRRLTIAISILYVGGILMAVGAVLAHLTRG